MLDPGILELARSLIHPQLAERQDALLRELKAIQRKAAAEGWYKAGRFVLTAVQLGDAEIKIRLRLVTGQLFRVVTEADVPPDPELEQNLKHELSIHAYEAKRSVTESIVSHLRHMDGRLVDDAKAKLSDAETRGVALLAGEIGLFAHKHNQPRAGTAAAQPVVNVAGSVGVIQTGDWAIANVAQNFGQDEKQAIENALVALRAYLDTHKEDTEELAGVVIEAEAEVAKGKPNLLRLKSLLMGAGATVQSIAAAQPAYEAIKVALRALGII